jgi:hypothetical protein
MEMIPSAHSLIRNYPINRARIARPPAVLVERTNVGIIRGEPLDRPPCALVSLRTGCEGLARIRSGTRLIMWPSVAGLNLRPLNLT